MLPPITSFVATYIKHSKLLPVCHPSLLWYHHLPSNYSHPIGWIVLLTSPNYFSKLYHLSIKCPSNYVNITPYNFPGTTIWPHYYCTIININYYQFSPCVLPTESTLSKLNVTAQTCLKLRLPIYTRKVYNTCLHKYITSCAEANLQPVPVNERSTYLSTVRQCLIIAGKWLPVASPR